MPSIATILAFLGFAGALASWIAGAVFCARALHAQGGSRMLTLLAPIVWPLALSRVRRAGEAASVQMNKALVAFIACMLVGTAAFAASANLSRFTK
ncbi:MAG: hypothetical protein JO348_01210 [Alphaproteobacteria bacterium]|nr:hypothetical protein [Alphaproteobacteria bacterium]